MVAETFLGTMLIAGCRRAAWARTDGPSGKEGTQMGAGLSCRPDRRRCIRSRNSAVHQEWLVGLLVSPGAGFAIWAIGRRGAEGKRKASIRSKRETGERLS